ncbi:hypothetical protein B617_gp21 [Nonlabens phage P12024S]|uniref:Uncharacterized protein n=1 Tax=Nonlabens phage P12024S TaxID=1168478 RepID=I6S2C9_9CAUD|nr:hypothetical protein B617_gp21 [Nonlabens phage P12024S]AFM54682.1 hypothetical protein P12024S_21 [Nonlabens phage P12024S]
MQTLYSNINQQKEQIERLIASGSVHPDNPFLIEINKKYRELCDTTVTDPTL